MAFNLSVFAARLKEVRDEIPLTQEELASATGVSRETIGAYEQGKRQPPISFLYDLCAITSISPGYFLGLVDAKIPSTIAASTIGVTEDAVKVLQELYDFKPHLSLLLNRLLLDESFIELLNYITFHHYIKPTQYGSEYGKFARYEAHSALDDLLKRVESRRFTPTHSNKNSLDITTQHYVKSFDSLFDHHRQQLLFDLKDMDYTYGKRQPKKQSLDEYGASKLTKYKENLEKRNNRDEHSKTIEENAEEIAELAKHTHVDNDSMF